MPSIIPPILILPDGNIRFMDIKTNMFVGIMENFQYEEEEFILERGTKLFLYTDGVTEAENEAKELYSEQQLLKTLIKNTSLDVKSTIDVVLESVASHVRDASRSDDLTMLIIHYKSKSKIDGERD